MEWFTVDKAGLGKLLERRGKGWVIAELIQNAWDESKTTVVQVTLEPVPGRPLCRLSVVDNSPDGFRNLTHAYTLFAESYKKGNEQQRGRFNLGEKLVLALCETAVISSTTGTVEFNNEGRQMHPRRKRETGTQFEAMVKMTREEYEEVCAEILRLIPPPSIETVFNGVPLARRSPIATFKATLPTEIADGQGILRRVRRETTVKVYEPHANETAWVYEMGIPVAETGDKYLVDVQQKVPLNMERDALPEAYLRELRAVVLNATAEMLTPEDASATWVGDAMEDDRVEAQAVTRVMDQRFGKKRVVFDPSDREANALATSQGHTVIAGGTFSKKQWDNIKAANAALPAGQVTPSPKPFSPDGKPIRTLSPDKYGPEHRGMESLAKWIARKTMGRGINVVFAIEPTWPFAGAYGPDGRLYINATQPQFRGRIDLQGFIDFAIHEFGHEYEGNHLSASYYNALTRIGAALAVAVAEEPAALQLLQGDES